MQPPRADAGRAACPHDRGRNGEILTRLTHKIARVTGTCRSATQALLNGADADPELRRELLAGIDEKLQELDLVVENIAAWRALELDTLLLARQPLDLRSLLTPALARWQYVVTKRGLGWRAELPGQLPPVAVDPGRILQALNNLLVNALDYTACGGAVSVRAAAQDSEVWIEVGNTGPGLSAEELTHVFEPCFSSVHQGRFPQGVGLGLAVARQLVERHDGRLTVDSETGQGLRFRIWLPQSTASSV